MVAAELLAWVSDELFTWPFFVLLLVIWIVSLRRMERSGTLDRWNATKALGFILMVRTTRGLRLLEWISKPRRFWRAFGEVSLWTCRLSMFFVALMLLASLVLMLVHGPSPPPPASTLIAVPGINPVIPLGWGAFVFIISLVIHEMGHGIQARAHGMRIRSFGLLALGPLPLGAFAEPQYDELSRAPRRERQRMFAAGPATNIFTALLCFFAIVLISGQFAAGVVGVHAQGIVDHEQSGALTAGLGAYDVITHMDGEPIEDTDDFEQFMATRGAGDTVVLTIDAAEGSQTPGAIEVVLGDKYAYQYDAWNTSAPEDLDDDGVVDEHDFAVYLENNREMLEMFGFWVEPGDAFLGVSGLSDNTAGVDRLAGPWAPNSDRGTAGKLLSTPLHAFALLYMPFEYSGVPMHPAQEDMLAAGEGPVASVLGLGGLMFLLYLFFWMVWINILLGLTNLIPMVPFDGGHLFKDMVHDAVSFIDRMRGRLGMLKWHPLRIESAVNRMSGMSSFLLLFILLFMLGLPYLAG